MDYWPSSNWKLEGWNGPQKNMAHLAAHLLCIPWTLDTSHRANTFPRSAPCVDNPLERLPCPFTARPSTAVYYLRTNVSSDEGDADVSSIKSRSITTPVVILLEDEEDLNVITSISDLIELLRHNPELAKYEGRFMRVIILLLCTDRHRCPMSRTDLGRDFICIYIYIYIHIYMFSWRI